MDNFIPIFEVDMNKHIEVTTRLELKQYTRLLYYLTYRKKAIIFMTGLGLYLMIPSVLMFLGVYTGGKGEPYPQLIIGFLMAIVLPISIYFQAQKNYKGNKRLAENVKYIFNQDTVQIEGESFNSTLSWNKMHKVVEIKNWILIYENPQIAMFISKSSFTAEQLKEFKSLLRTIDGLKVKLA